MSVAYYNSMSESDPKDLFTQKKNAELLGIVGSDIYDEFYKIMDKNGIVEMPWDEARFYIRNTLGYLIVNSLFKQPQHEISHFLSGMIDTIQEQLKREYGLEIDILDKSWDRANVIPSNFSIKRVYICQNNK
jgi:hypothetical protein